MFCASQIRDEKASIDIVLELILRRKNNRNKKNQRSDKLQFSFFDANARQPDTKQCKLIRMNWWFQPRKIGKKRPPRAPPRLRLVKEVWSRDFCDQSRCFCFDFNQFYRLSQKVITSDCFVWKCCCTDWVF